MMKELRIGSQKFSLLIFGREVRSFVARPRCTWAGPALSKINNNQLCPSPVPHLRTAPLAKSCADYGKDAKINFYSPRMFRDEIDETPAP